MKGKNISFWGRVTLTVWQLLLFSIVWIFFYNRYTFDTYRTWGGLFAIGVFYLLYHTLAQIYGAFKIASVSIGETVFSQMMSFGIANTVLYVGCCLAYNRYVPIWYGIITLLLQIMGTAAIVTFFKHYFMTHISPEKTVFIYGQHVGDLEVYQFKYRILSKYQHLFQIEQIIQETGKLESILNVINHHEIILLYEVKEELRTVLAKYCIQNKKTLYISPTIMDVMLQGCSMKHLLDTPLVKYNYAYEGWTGSLSKRSMDIVGALLGLILTAPLMLVIAAAIKLEDGGPVFYRQERCTKGGKIFKILKFRSMLVDAEKEGMRPCMEQDDRITTTGNVIRKMRCDELPQLWNILIGDMSLVGPRPERVEHVHKYTENLPEFQYRMCVKGGLTGYAQIFGKYNTSPYDKLRLDLIYIENRTMILDLKIILLTIKVLFLPESTEGFTEENGQRISGNYPKVYQQREKELDRAK